MEIKKKAQLVITLDESGGVGVQSSSSNLVTIFGMLEMAKKAYIEAGLQGSKSNILVPNLS